MLSSTKGLLSGTRMGIKSPNQTLQKGKSMSGYLVGQSEHSLDAKGRLIVPIRFREGLGSKFVLCNGYQNNYIQIYPMDEWEKFANDLFALDMRIEKNRHKQNYFFGSMHILEADGQYRIVIPQKIREEMHIDKEIVLVGMFKTAQLWSKSEWEKEYGRSIDTVLNDSKDNSEAVSDE